MAPCPRRRPAASFERSGEQVQKSLDLTRGPLTRALLFRGAADAGDRLLLVAHHLVVDGVSWRILLEDLDLAYEQLAAGREPSLPARTTSFQAWARDLLVSARSGEVAAELAWWADPERREEPAIPVDEPGGDNTEGSVRLVKVALDRDATRALLRDLPAVYRTEVQDALLAALAWTFAGWTQRRRLLVDLEGHGREETLVPGSDLTRTVGWFTSVYPVLLDLTSVEDPGGAIKAVKEQLRAVPRRGIGYGLLRHLGTAAPELAVLPRAAVLFNYFGQLDAGGGSAFGLAEEGCGAATDGGAEREHLLELNCGVVGGALEVGIRYSGNLHRHATVEALAERYLASLRELIAHCLSPEAGGFTPSDFPLAGLGQAALDRLSRRIGRQPVEDVYRLSPMQQGMLFHALAEPERGLYVGRLHMELEGALNPEAFRRAWAAVADRHPALRTAFLWEEADEPLQVVYRNVPTLWQELDWRELPRGRAGEPLRRAPGGGRGLLVRPLPPSPHPSDPRPLGRGGLPAGVGPPSGDPGRLEPPLGLAGGRGALPSELEGSGLRLPAARPYRDYIAWLGRQDMAAARQHWERELAGFAEPTTVNLGPGSGRSAAAPSRGVVQLELTTDATRELVSLARRRGLTLNTLVAGAWALLLSRYADREDVAFGVTVSGRPGDLPGVDTIVGLFINTLPLRVKTPPRERLLLWLGRLQERQARLRRYEHTPLAEIQAWSELGRGRSLFESFLVFQNYPVGEGIEAAGLRLGRVGEVEWANYPLALVATPGERLRLQLGHDGARFEPAGVERMLGHLSNLLSAVAAAPQSLLAELPMLSAAERRQLLVEWNGKAGPGGWSAVPQLLAEVARRRPEAPAVVAGDEVLSHRELHRCADRLAARLRELGVRPEARVGLCVERAAGLAVGLLGIWKAGGAYVPFDAELPAARLRAILDGAEIGVVVTEGVLARRLPLGDERAVCLDEEASWPPRGDAPPPEDCEPASLAYVVYTSGSTGEPKGVAVGHEALASFAVEAARRFGLQGEDRILQFSPLSFNVVLEELLPVWLAGGAAVLERQVDRLAPRQLGELIAARRVTGLELPAAYWHEWVDELELAGERPPKSLRFVILGCEKPHPRRVESWNRWGVPLINVFGLTETTVTSSLYRTEDGPADRLELPIGRPLDNSRMYLLDGRGELVPVGVVGELHIGGAGVGRGYLGQPGLTAERFVPDALGGEPGARLYRTGDLCRFETDGILELLGRRDHQVKVRGFRVELAEIETALQRHPGVGEAVAVAHRNGASVARLVAYVQPAAGWAEPLVARELRELLAATLPEYMVPAALEVVGELPRTATGKVDRGALPEPSWGAGEDAEYQAPRNLQEETLAAIWREVLGLERVGVAENFFELGGDSILSLQIVSRAHRAGLRLTPKQLFQHPTVAALAAVVREAEPAARADDEAVAGEAPLTPAQRWFFAREPARPAHWNLSVFLVVRRPLAAAPLGRALEALVEHHDALRLRYRRSEMGWRQEHGSAAGSWPLLEVDLSGLPAGRANRELARTGGQAQASLDLGQGPLARAVLYRFGSASGDRLLLAAHHLIVDGVSWRILLEDLETVYGQLAAGGEPDLPARTTSFQRWAEALLAHAWSAALREELPYWTAAGRDTVPAVPLDHPAGANVEGSAEAVTVTLEPGLTRALLREVPGIYHTEIQDILLAALARTFEGWTQQPRLLLDLEGHGREEEILPGADLTRTVGWLATLTPLLLDLSGAAGPGGIIKAVKEQLRAIPLRGIGHGVLRHLEPESGELLRRLPQSEVIFEYMGRLDRALPESTPFALAPEAAGPDADPLALRTHLLSVWGGVVDGELQITWTYSRNLHERSTITALAGRFLAVLRELIEHCLSPEAGGFTPSDFPLAALDQAALDLLLTRFDGRRLEDVYPLSPMQQGMLFHTLHDRGAGVYVGQLGLELSGPLRPPLVEQAWQNALARHPALRTGFILEGMEGPLQVIFADVDLRVEPLDWRGLGPAEREARWARLLADLRNGFELSQPPLMQITLVRLDEDLHWLLWCYHMILFDGWSQAILLTEVFRDYAALAKGERPLSQTPRTTYRDYIAWLMGQDPAASRDFWTEYLAGFTSPTPFGAYGRPGTAHAAGDSLRLEDRRLTIAASAALRSTARRHRVTLNTLAQAAWAFLLARSSGEPDVLFGSTVSGRAAGLDGIESMVGLFINTLPLRTRVPREGSLADWVLGLQEQQAAVRQYEHVSLARIQGWSELPAGHSLFKSILVFQNFPVESSALGREAGLAIRPRGGADQHTYAVAVTVAPLEDLALKVSYDADRFDPYAIERMLGQLGRLLEQLAAGLDQPVAGLTLMSEAELHQVTVGWNDTARTYGNSACLHELFAAQVERTPEAAAVSYEDAALSYRELDWQAIRLANRLRSLGVGPEVVVGVSLPRSIEMVVALLAVLKAGGAYLPLDPDSPAERLGMMLGDARAAVLLYPAGGEVAALDAPGVRRLAIERLEPEAVPLAPGEFLVPPETTADNLAYVIFTSGSTGRPKGAMVPHRAVVNRILWLLDRYPLTVADRDPAEELVQLRRLGPRDLRAAVRRGLRDPRAPGRTA